MSQKDYPGKGRKHVALQLRPEQMKHLRTIKRWMVDDPDHDQGKIGNQSAVVYALEHTVANPPKHVGGNRG